ncbi:hypothetical protein [Acidovorax sp. SUPP2825]|uniref:hypothetical protein n=1 Tax=Acidovorax sp. SUPP2825 TaxID=2920879 RepID=UPI0023DE5A41|nr:hypothetical protein [Acidovorax sp. SUPP2825]GKS95400.1 alpha/beta hydrolase [Acidovorax sp. SUPP2825]
MKASITDLTQRRHLLALAAGLPLMGCVSSPPAGGTLLAGSHVLHFPAPGLGATSDDIRLHAHRPARWQPNDPVAIVMHGVRRDADRYLREWLEPAEDAGILVLVPEFTQAKFPGRNFYNFGNVADDKMNIRPSEQWVFRVVDDAFAIGRKAFGARRERFALYGHSAGAQFVHRYMLLAKESRAELIISANAGSYTLPNRDANFPWGLANVAATDEDLKRAFARQVVLLLGDKDIDPNHPNLPTDPEARAQGLNRFARGHYFYEQARAAAAKLGVPLRWRVQTVPGVAHSDHGMAPPAMKIMRQGVAA